MNKRKHYYLVVDVETTGSMANPLVYDIGFAVTDRDGNVYKKFSYVTKEIFVDERKIFNNPILLQSAFYKKKLPQYYNSLQMGDKLWVCKPIGYIRKVVENICLEYDIKAICAYNATFDARALDITMAYVTKSAIRNFFPPDIPIWDIWTMACETIGQRVSYSKFCLDNNFVSSAMNCMTSAEVMYCCLTDNPTFTEAHTGLEDVLIESFIMTEVFKTKKAFTKGIVHMPWKLVQPKFRYTAEKYYNIII